jgi:hypothetical protein
MREDAWRRRVDQRALTMDPPGWLLAELGPVPTDPQERTVWRAAAAELDGYRRAYGLDHRPPAKHGGARVARAGRAAADQRHRARLGRLLGTEPRRDAPGRRRDWQGAWAALERLADHRHRDDRHRPQERPDRLRGRDVGRAERDGR